MPAGRPNQTYSLQKLWGKQEELLRLFAAGAKPQAIADSLGITKQTVYNVCNSDMGRNKLALLQGFRDTDFQALQERIAEIAPVALEVLEETMLGETSDPKLKADTAKTLLSMAGHGPVKRVEKRTVTKLTEEDRKAIEKISQSFLGEPEDVDFKTL